MLSRHLSIAAWPIGADAKSLLVVVVVVVYFPSAAVRPLRSQWGTGRAELDYPQQVTMIGTHSNSPNVYPAFHRLEGAACRSLVPVSGSSRRVAKATMVNPWFSPIRILSLVRPTLLPQSQAPVTKRRKWSRSGGREKPSEGIRGCRAACLQGEKPPQPVTVIGRANLPIA